MSTEFNRFETSKRGYDPKAVERELKALNSELVRLREQYADTAEELKETRSNLEQAQRKLDSTAAPNFASLGAEAAELLIRAENSARELEEAASSQAAAVLEEANHQAAKLVEIAEQQYQEQMGAAERRAARQVAAAKHEAELLTANSRSEAKERIQSAELEVARIRGQAATEVAAIKTTAKREVEKVKAELASKVASQEYATLDKLGIENAAKELAVAELEAQLATRRKKAEEEYLDLHNQAVAETQGYLESAKKDLSSLKKTISTIRLEIQALEMEASQAQGRILQEARKQAEAIAHKADLEAAETLSLARQKALETEKASKVRVSEIENKVKSSELYLRKLRSLLSTTDQLED